MFYPFASFLILSGLWVQMSCLLKWVDKTIKTGSKIDAEDYWILYNGCLNSLPLKSHWYSSYSFFHTLTSCSTYNSVLRSDLRKSLSRLCLFNSVTWESNLSAVTAFRLKWCWFVTWSHFTHQVKLSFKVYVDIYTELYCKMSMSKWMRLEGISKEREVDRVYIKLNKCYIKEAGWAECSSERWRWGN